MDEQEQQAPQNKEASASSTMPASPLEKDRKARRPIRFLSKMRECRDRICEAASISKIRQKLRRRRYRVRKGDPAPKPPPYCPHWHKPRYKVEKAYMKIGTERLRVYTPGHKTRLEKYEERMREAELKEARLNVGCHSSESNSQATTLTAQQADLEAELESLSKQLQESEFRNEQLVKELFALHLTARRDQPEEPQEAHASTEETISGHRSLGTVALKGKEAPNRFGHLEASWQSQSIALLN